VDTALTMEWSHRGGYPVAFRSHALGGDGRPATADVRGLIADRRVLVVTTPTPWVLHGVDRLPAIAAETGTRMDVLVLALDESRKTTATVLEVCRRADELSLGRGDLLLAFGGGLVSDVVTVAASMLHRGTPYACMPTTLVGQVDAGVGVKGAVNLDGAKNRLGTFHPPEAVVSDPAWLLTLDDTAMRSGLSEILKVGIARDRDLFEYLEAFGPDVLAGRCAPSVPGSYGMLQSATAAMLDELALTPFEDQRRPRLMDFGHTYSPALERASRYAMTHGAAVAVDMALSTEIAVGLGLLARSDADTIGSVLADLGLVVSTPWCTPDLVRDGIDAARRHRSGELNMVVPVGIGKAEFVDDVPKEVVESALRRLRTATRTSARADVPRRRRPS
jgi:3-dehydroquinate synthase